MIRATEAILKEIDVLSDRRKEEILNAKDLIEIKGTVYYVSNAGKDTNDGKTPETAWQTLDKVSTTDFAEGDGVLFCRGDLFRGFVKTRPGVTYAAYGTGDKPKFYGWDHSLADPALWEQYDAEHHIWKLNELILDCGTLVFNDGEAHCRKLIPSYIHGCFVCRDNESRIFDMAQEMTRDLDLVCFYEERLTDKPSKGESFPVPIMDSNSYGTLYLRCDRGNPAEVFQSMSRSIISASNMSAYIPLPRAAPVSRDFMSPTVRSDGAAAPFKAIWVLTPITPKANAAL